MGIAVIDHKDELFSIWIHHINKVFNLFCPVGRCTVFPDAYMVPAPKGFNKGKYAACPIAYVFRVYFLVTAWAHGEGFPYITQ